MNALTNGATIEVVATGEKYHTLKDWGLAISNNNCIEDVEQEKYYVDVPGADGFLDFSEVITGRRIFKKRPINIEVGGKKPRNEWDIIISNIRNKIEGREVKVIFDNDPEFYWIGRASVKGFNRNREIGTFTIAIPIADPYKYRVTGSTDPWLWDPFNFRTGIIDLCEEVELETPASVYSYTIIADGTPFVPIIQVNQLGDAGITMTVEEEEYILTKGKNRFADIIVDQKNVTLEFSGQGKFIIVFRRKSL